MAGCPGRAAGAAACKGALPESSWSGAAGARRANGERGREASLCGATNAGQGRLKALCGLAVAW